MTATFSDRLLPGERVLWTGRPTRELIFGPRDVFLVPFSILWCGFAIFWTATVIISGAPVLWWIWGSMFVLVGLAMSFGRFFLDAWARRSMVYAVTNQRILIERLEPWPSFTALSLRLLPDARLSERRNGLGWITFGQPSSPFSGGNSFGTWVPALDPSPQFIGIADPRTVFQVVQRAQQAEAG
jgi:hypothetical protein